MLLYQVPHPVVPDSKSLLATRLTVDVVPTLKTDEPAEFFIWKAPIGRWLGHHFYMRRILVYPFALRRSKRHPVICGSLSFFNKSDPGHIRVFTIVLLFFTRLWYCYHRLLRRSAQRSVRYSANASQFTQTLSLPTCKGRTIVFW